MPTIPSDATPAGANAGATGAAAQAAQTGQFVLRCPYSHTLPDDPIVFPGYPGLSQKYGLTFAAPPRAMDLSLIYRALADRQVDLIAGDATSGLIAAYDLVMLDDNRHYFPPYDAVLLARPAQATLVLERTGNMSVSVIVAWCV